MISKYLITEFIKSSIRIILPFSIAIGIGYYFLFVSPKDESTGSIRITSDPPGILIVLDGTKTILHTDTTIIGVKSGQRRISLDNVKWLCKPELVSIELKPNETKTVHFVAQPNPNFIETNETKTEEPKLSDFPISNPNKDKQSMSPMTPIPVKKENSNKLGNIQVSCNQPDADIFLNDKKTDLKTPAILSNLSSGTYKISVSKSGFRSVPEFANVKLDADVGISYTHFELVSQIQKTTEQLLVIITNPEVNGVIVNGKNVGTTPFRKNLPLGRYKIEFPLVLGYSTPAPQTIMLEERDSTFVKVNYMKSDGNSFLAIFVPKNAEAVNLGKLKIQLNGKNFFNGAPTESRHVIWGSIPEGEVQVTVIFDNLTTDLYTTFQDGYVTPIELKFERYFTQVKPKLRSLEPRKYSDYRQVTGQVTFYP